MAIKIALAGNPNSGKTTLFNSLTGSNQFVGNWPGVTVEKKEGKLKGHKDVVIMDLPGIYSLSPYTLEEVVARNYLIGERPDAILNIVDGTNLKGTGVMDAAKKAVELAGKKNQIPVHKFGKDVEAALDEIESFLGGEIPEEQKRFYAIKLFERDDKISARMTSVPNVESIIKRTEAALDDDAESIITNERYEYIASIIKDSYVKKAKGQMTVSDKIDRIVTNRFAALPRHLGDGLDQRRAVRRILELFRNRGSRHPHPGWKLPGFRKLRGLAVRPDSGRHRSRRGRGFGLCASDAGAVYFPGLFGVLRIHGQSSLYYGPYFPQVRAVRKVLYSHADRNRLRRSRRYGFPYH